MRMILAFLAMLLAPMAAQAEDWPVKPIVMVVSYPPGAITDTVGRRVADRLGAALGQSVVVENRGGAGGNVAAAHVTRQAPDGYTLLFTSYGNLIIAAAAEQSVGFHPWRDLAPVAMIGPMTVMLLVRPSLPVEDLRGFIRHAASHPGQVNFASVGVGSSYHLLIEQMNTYGGLQMTHVPYRGGAAAMTDLLAGRVDATLATLLFARPYMTAGTARPIAVANAERSPVLPDMPRVGEAAPGAALVDGLAVYAPAGTPAPIIARLNAALSGIIAAPAMRDWLTGEGVTPSPGPPERLVAETHPAAERMRDLLKRANIRLQ